MRWAWHLWSMVVTLSEARTSSSRLIDFKPRAKHHGDIAGRGSILLSWVKHPSHIFVMLREGAIFVWLKWSNIGTSLGRCSRGVYFCVMHEASPMHLRDAGEEGSLCCLIGSISGAFGDHFSRDIISMTLKKMLLWHQCKDVLCRAGWRCWYDCR